MAVVAGSPSLKGVVEQGPAAPGKAVQAAEQKLGKAANSVRANYNSAIEALKQVGPAVGHPCTLCERPRPCRPDELA